MPAKYNTEFKKSSENLSSSSDEDLAKNERLGKIDKGKEENVSRLPGKKYKETQEKPLSSRTRSKKGRDSITGIKDASEISNSLADDLEELDGHIL